MMSESIKNLRVGEVMRERQREKQGHVSSTTEYYS